MVTHAGRMSVEGLVEDLLDFVPVLLYQVCTTATWGMCISCLHVEAQGGFHPHS